MRRLAYVAVLALAAACGQSESGDTRPKSPSPDSAAFPPGLSGEDRPYSGEWAAQADDCTDSRKVWTIEDNRMGVRKQRFCVFSQVRQTEGNTEAEVWRADARCLAAGQESDDVLFFRVKPGRHEMRVRISDADPEELVRCPMRT